MLVVMRMFLDPIRDGFMRTLETDGVDGVAADNRQTRSALNGRFWSEPLGSGSYRFWWYWSEKGAGSER